MNKKVKLSSKITRIVLRIILLCLTIIMIYPLVWNIIASLKSNEEILESPWTLPMELHFENFVRAFTEANIGGYVFNSIFVTVLSLIIMLILAIPASYVIARFHFPGRKFLHNFFLAGLFIQPILIMVPLFLLVNDLKMTDNIFSLSIIYAITNISFSIYLLIGFMKTIPKEYEEAARIDGCGYISTLIRIIIPLAKPGIITVSIFNFFTFWNEYALALVLITSDEKKTIPVGLVNLMEVQRYATDWSALFAGLVIVLIPTVVIYVLVHRKLTEGMMMGGIKG
ncbi:carbohydrate ABC transporter permease [Gracilibacillus sp. D59]|uniref:carbohydrate ABC transporter permease n=1 Tax=Gracilibacillus sp. D59 TaxID=3457434 RepID=UPI003FCDAF32